VFTYDAAGARVKKVGPTEETLTLGGLYERRVTPTGTDHVFFVSGGDGTMTQILFAERSPRADQITYLHTDALGTTGATTDAAGSVTRLYHEPFGARIAANGSALVGAPGDVRLGFTGQVADDDLDLVNMKGRIYSPTQRRFLSPDPLVSAPTNAQSYNRYSYVWNNPLNFIDPSGFEGDPPPQGPDQGPDNHTSEGGPGNTGGQGGGGTAYHTGSGSGRKAQTQATPYKGSPAPGASTGASSAHDANVHHDRMLALDLDRGNSSAVDKFVRSANAHEPGNGAANLGLVLADWLRTGVAPNGPELKVALNGAAQVAKQTAPLLQTTPAPVVSEPVPPVATTPPAVTGGASEEGPLLPRPTHEGAHGFTIRDINPTGNALNCADCACAVDDLLAGKEPWAAPTSKVTVDYHDLERAFGLEFSEPMPLNDLLSAMNKAGPGARGIVFGIPILPTKDSVGHFFNVANQREVVRFLDGQTGTGAKTAPFGEFRLMRTNP
jgi:RHS repeat-associated protein